MPNHNDESHHSVQDASLIDEIRNLYESGLTLRELSRQLGKSDEVIRRLMITAGIKRRPRGQPEGKYLPNGGRTTDRDGYILVKANSHPSANSNGYVREHRLVMESVLGRYLTSDEVVHHIDGNKANNAPENLHLYASNAEHKRDDMVGNEWALGDFNNPKRKVRKYRSQAELLDCLRVLAASLGRPIQRSDLQPPNPSYRAIARAFGSWQTAVALALDDEFLEDWIVEHGPLSTVAGGPWQRTRSARDRARKRAAPG
jgi:hypothetical protein